jgi:hypothetical protein
MASLEDAARRIVLAPVWARAERDYWQAEAKSWEFQFMHDGCHCDECGAPMPYPPDDPRWEEEDE